MASLLSEVAYLDTYPASDATTFSGVWGVYPYLASGLVLATDLYGDLFLLHAELDAVPVCADGLDNDGDGGFEAALLLPLLTAWRTRRHARRKRL